MTTTLLTVVIALTGVLATLVAWLGWRETHRDRVSTADTEKIKAIVQAAIQEYAERQHDEHVRIDGVVERQTQQQSDQHEMNDKMGKVLDRLAILETKIEVFWRTVAMDAARIIHSPDPKRKHIDDLLDAFTAGTITTVQAGELRRVLMFLRDWEPGKPSDFPVYPGEQVAAAILLRTMDLSLESRRKKS